MLTEAPSDQDTPRAPREAASLAFARRVLIATLVVASVLSVLYFAWYAADLLMLVFAGVLVSILLRGFSRILMRATGLGHGPSLALVALGLIALVAAGAWMVTGRLGSQMSELQRQLPQ